MSDGLTYKERQEYQKQLQNALASAAASIELAKEAADKLKQSFDFLGRTYQPKQVVESGGHFDHEVPAAEPSWEQSYDWQASSC